MSGNPRRSAAADQLDPGQVVRFDSPSLQLTLATIRGLRRGGDGQVRGGLEPVGAERLREVDAEAVAAWLVSHYDGVRAPDGGFRGVVVGSPHASAAHLALAFGVPWLPATFDVAVRPPLPEPQDPGAVIERARRLTGAVCGANPEVAVRQVHDPLRRQWPIDRTITLRVAWRRVPAAYREFFADRLAPGAPIIMVRDVSRWLVVNLSDRSCFQFGSRVGGLGPLDYYQGGDEVSLALAATGGAQGATGLVGRLPGYSDAEGEYAVEPLFVDDLRWRSTAQTRKLRQVLYRRSNVFAAAVADLYRRWLRAAGRTGNRLVVESGKLHDPWHVLRAGLVPYWCEYPLTSEVAALEWWLAGSETFSSIEILAEPPGMSLPGTAYLAQWDSVAAFAGRRGLVDPRCARSYPLGGLPAGHAATMLAQQPYDLPYLLPMAADTALDELAGTGETSGLLVV